MNEKILVTAPEAAQMLSIGRSTFWRMVKDEKLPAPVRIGGATRWRVDDLRSAIGLPATSPTSPSAAA